MIKEKLQNLLAKAGLVKEVQVKNDDVGKLIPYPIMGVDPPDKKATDYLNAAQGWVYSCVSAISDEVAKTQLRLYKRTNDNELEEITSHPLLDLLYRVNSFTTKFDHWWLSQQYLELVGEAPWYLNRPNPSAEPNAMILLRPDKLTIVYGDDIIEGYEYIVDEQKQSKIFIEPQDLIFIRYPAPLKQFRGKGTAEAMPKTIDIDDFSEEWNRKFFYNSARPDAVLKTEQTLNDDQIKRLKAQWNEKYQGLSNSSKLAVLEAGLNYEPIAPSQSDMQFIEQQKFTRDKILGIFRVPKSIVAQTEGVNFASAKVSQYNFARFTIDPKIRRVVEQLNEFLVPQFGDDLILDYDSVIPEDDEVKLKAYENGLNNGWMTINEVRQKEGLDEIEGGDEARVSTNTMTLGVTATPEKPADEKILRLKARTRVKDEIKEEFKKVVKNQIYKDLKEKKEQEKKDKKNKELEKKEVYWKELVRRTELQERKILMAVKMIFKKQRAKVLASMTRTQKLGFDVEKETENMAKTLKPILFDIAKENGNEAINHWNLKDYFSGIDFEEYFGTQLSKIKDINETTSKKLKQIVKNGIDEGLGISDVKNNIKEAFVGFDDNRAIQIARTETLKYANWATQEAYEQSGVVVGKEWVTALDERTCPWCRSLDGKTVQLETKFFEQGDSYSATNRDGKEVTIDLDYEPIVTPPLHSNCRCTLAPIIGTPKKVEPKVEKKKEVKKKPVKSEKKDDEIINLRKQINNILDDEK